MLGVAEQMSELRRGAQEILPEAELEKKLAADPRTRNVKVSYVGQVQLMRDTFSGIGLDPVYNSPQEYTEMLKSGYNWNVQTIALLKKRGVKFDF